MKLTNQSVKALTTPADRQTYCYDDALSGFGVRCSPGGKKSYFVQFRHGGRATRKTLGSATVLSADVAREKAREMLAKVALGIELEPRASMTLQDAYDTFRENHLAHRSVSYRHLAGTIWRLHVPPKLKRVDVATITRRDLFGITDAITKTGKKATAHFAMSLLKVLFNWLADRGEIASSPLVRAKLPFKLKARDRVFDEDELARMWNAARSLAEPYSLVARLLMVTACRKSEILELRTGEVRRGALVLDAARVKNRHEHRLPLPIQLREDLAAHHLRVCKKRPADERVFHICPQSLKAKLTEGSGVKDWTLHDLRRTAATTMAALGVAPHIVENVLNHRSAMAGNVGVAAIYNRYRYDAEVAAALQTYEDHLASLAQRVGIRRRATAGRR